MKKYTKSVLVVVTLVMCGLASVGYALEQNTMPAGSTFKTTPPVISTEGSISSVDLGSPTPSVVLTMAGGGSQTFQLGPTTTIWKSGQALTAAQLKVGDRVKVRHMTRNSKEIVKSVEVL